MDSRHKINFYQDRNFGDIITVTFDFIAQNIQIILRLLLRVAMPLLVLGFIITGLSFYQIVAHNGGISRGWMSFVGILIFIAGMFLYYFSIMYMMLEYDRVEHPDQIDLSRIWHNTLKHLKRFLGVSILTALIITFSYLFFILPGIILYVFFSMVYQVIVFEDAKASQALSRSFGIVGGNWWRTFFLTLILILIQILFNYLADAPVYLAAMFGLIDFSGSISAFNQNLPLYKWILYGIYFFIQYIILVILGIISIIGTTFLYFSIREQKENAGLIREIEAIGTHSNEEDDYDY
jgi:hypothetical protein